MAPPAPNCACSPSPGASPSVRKNHNSRRAPRPMASQCSRATHCPPLLRCGRCSQEEEKAGGGCLCGVPQAASSVQMDYKKISEDVSSKMFLCLKDTSGWKEVRKGKLITVSSKPSTDYSGNMYRVEATIEQPAEKVFPFLYLPEHRAKWDKSLQSYKMIDTIDQDTAVYHIITHSYGLGLVPPRDFVYILHIKRYDDLLTTNSTSVEHPGCPPCPSYIRGKTYPSSYACYPSPENPSHCKMLALVQVDLGGLLRPAVVQSVMPNSLMNLVTDCRAGIKTIT